MPKLFEKLRDAGGEVFEIGQVGGARRNASLSCSRRNGGVLLSLDDSSSDAPATIRTSSVTRQVPVLLSRDSAIVAAVSLSPRDPLLDAMAFSRGRFAIEQPGTPPLVLPAWPEIGRVIEDCRG